MKLSKHYKSSEYIFLFSILVLAIFLGTYFSFYAFLWRDIESEVKGFSKTHQMNYQEGFTSNKPDSGKSNGLKKCPPGQVQCRNMYNNCIPTCISGVCVPDGCQQIPTSHY